MMHPILSNTQRLLDGVTTFISATLLLLALLVVYDAVMRYAFQSGSIMLQELQWHLFDIIFLGGIAYTQKQDAHVRIDIFYQHYTLKSKKRFAGVVALFCILPFSALIIYEGAQFAYEGYAQMEGSSNPGGLPYRFIIYSVMPLGFVLLTLQTLLQLIKGR